MDRLTHRKKNGNLKLDVSAMVIRKLAEYEDTGLEPFEVKDIKLVYERYKSAPSCNNCGIRYECKFCLNLDPGDPIVLNCPLWVSPRERSDDF